MVEVVHEPIDDEQAEMHIFFIGVGLRLVHNNPGTVTRTETGT